VAQLGATASAIMTFTEKLEDYSATLYQEFGERYPESRDLFFSFAEESKKNKTLIVRTYQETITDALEACFCFRGMNLAKYSLNASPSKHAKYVDALKSALQLEEKATEFYCEVARLSENLLATIPRVFKKTAERRKIRQQVLRSLAEKI